MRSSSRWFRAVLPACLALCVFLLSVTTSSAHRVSTPFDYVDHGHNFGLHGSLTKRSRSEVPQSVSPNTTTITGTGNWSGFLVGSGSGNGFKETTGNWNTPCTSGTVDHNHLAAEWVGLGGY